MVADTRNPFALLGLTPAATDQEISQSYRKLVRELHPDKQRSDPEKKRRAKARLADINWAKQQIGTPKKRVEWVAAYEEEQQRKRAVFGVDLGFDDDQESAMPRHGRDVEVKVNLNFRESLQGKRVEVSFISDSACSQCGGTGAAPGSAPRPCAPCSGSGLHSVGNIASVCASCQGKRIQIAEPCDQCSGEGKVKVKKAKRVQIAPGVINGQKITIPQEGMPGYQRNGDLIINITVEKSPIFSRYDGSADLRIELPVSFAEAVFGKDIVIPTPSGRVKLPLPPETSSGTLLRIPGQGAPVYGGKPGQRGDLFARVMIVAPQEVNDVQERLIRQLGIYDNDEELRGSLFPKESPQA